MSAIAGLIGRLERKLSPVLRKSISPMLNRVPKARSLGEFFEVLTSALTPQVLAELSREMGDWSGFDSEVQEIMSGSWQRIRDSGLYVDVLGSEIHEPIQLSRQVAAKHIRALTTVLRGLRLLKPATALTDSDLAYLAQAPSISGEIEAMWQDMLGDPADVEP